MTARFAVGDSVIAPIPGFPRMTGAQFGSGSVLADAGGYLFAVDPGTAAPGSVPKIFGWNHFGGPVDPGFDSTGLLPLPPAVLAHERFFDRVAVGFIDDDLYPDIVFGANGAVAGHLYAFELRDDPADGDLFMDMVFEVPLPYPVTAAPLLTDSAVVFGTGKGFVYVVGFDGNIDSIVHLFSLDSSDVVTLAAIPGNGGIIAGSSSGEEGYLNVSACHPVGMTPQYIPSGSGPAYLASGIMLPGSDTYVVTHGDGTISLVDACLGYVSGFPFNAGGEIRGLPAIADVDGDGQKDIVVFSGKNIYALNMAGAPLDNFPVPVETDSILSGSPVVADLNGDGRVEIAGVTSEGVVFAFGPDGRMMNGLPLQAGPNNGVTPAVFYTQSACLSCADIALSVATTDGYLYAWRTGTIITGPMAPPEQAWPQFAHDGRNTASESMALTPAPRSDEFLPASLTYNWPNPVGREDGYRTFIRYYVPTDASITIRIFNLAGELVEIFEGIEATGGVDNEIAWDVSGVQSGVYFAHVEAAGAGGSGNAVIRIAVVR
jgi:hypothetical protein